MSRGVPSAIIGKYTDQIPAIRIAPETKDELERQAHDAGVNLNEFVRLLLMIRAHGLDTVLKVQEQRLRVVSGLSAAEDRL